MQEQKPPSRKKQPLINYTKYSGMAIQMALTMAAGIYGGIKLDEYTHWVKFPVFTLTFSLLGIFASMYFAIRKILKK